MTCGAPGIYEQEYKILVKELEQKTSQNRRDLDLDETIILKYILNNVIL